MGISTRPSLNMRVQVHTLVPADTSRLCGTFRVIWTPEPIDGVRCCVTKTENTRAGSRSVRTEGQQLNGRMSLATYLFCEQGVAGRNPIAWEVGPSIQKTTKTLCVVKRDIVRVHSPHRILIRPCSWKRESMWEDPYSLVRTYTRNLDLKSNERSQYLISQQ